MRSTFFFGLYLVFALFFAGCDQKEETPKGNYPWQTGFDLQGHRGCRGLMPENSLPGFRKAVSLGVNTLEMDVVISRDSQVLLSHDPFLSHEICLDLEGNPIADSLESDYTLFEMDYATIRSFDCGSKPHPRFPEQQKLPVYKPLLSEVIDSVESWSAIQGLTPFWYNIETKSSPAGDGVLHPAPETFVQLLLSVIRAKDVDSRVVIQSFDPRTLQVVHRLAPEIPLALLVENQLGFRPNLEILGFTPAIYSPDQQLVDASLVDSVHQYGMALIPWTVNDTANMRRLLDLGVEGLITDYPDRIRNEGLKD